MVTYLADDVGGRSMGTVRHGEEWRKRIEKDGAFEVLRKGLLDS